MFIIKEVKFLICLFSLCFLQLEGHSINLSAEKKEILFQGVPLVIEEIVDKYCGLTIHTYDPADSVLAPQEIPFMTIEIDFDEDGDIEEAGLSELGRTDSLNGNQLIELVKYLQAEYRIPRLEVIDVAHTLSCQMEGNLCNHEATHNLSPITVYLSGKSFYERGGAVPIIDGSEKQVYRTAADFLHQTLRVDQLMQDLRSTSEHIPKAANLADFIQKAIVVTGSPETDLIAGLFARSRVQSNQDLTSHKMWHGLLNRLVGQEDNFLVELSGYFLAHQEMHPEVVGRFCASSILSYVDDAIAMNEQFFDPSLDSNQAKREFYFDHQVEIFEKALQFLDCGRSIDDNEKEDIDREEKGILEATYKYRLNKEVLKSTQKTKMSYIPYLREHYYRAKAYHDQRKDPQAQFKDWDDAEDFDLHDGDLWCELAEWIRDDSANNEQTGYTCLRWYVAREMISQFNLFQFILADK